jgi:hypothetical protein
VFSLFSENIAKREGLSIDINKWDVSSMKDTLAKLQQSGLTYTVNDFNAHLDMLLNKFNVQYETDVLVQAESDFPSIENGQCYRDNPYRYIPSYRKVMRNFSGWFLTPMNYNDCKQFAIEKNMNSFGLQWGYECWVGNLDDNMNNGVGKGPTNSEYKKIDKSACNKWGNNENGTGGGWANMVYKKIPSKKLNKIKNYEEIIKKFVNSGLYSDEDVLKANNFNMNAFTTMEGFEDEIINGIPVSGRSIKASDKITITNANAQQSNIITNNIIDIIVNNKYAVQTTNFHEFINKFKTAGKNIKDAQEYILAMKAFGVESETIANKMTARLYINTNPAPFHDIIRLITVYFKNYGITNVNAIFNTLSPREENGWFMNAVETHKLNALSLPLLPSTVPNSSTDSVMELLYAIDKSIKTLGENNMGQFFSDFTIYGVKSADFFKSIYPIYSDPTFKIYDYYTPGKNKSPLSDALYKINGLSTSGLIAGFNTLKSLLGANGLNLDFNSFVAFTDTLNTRVSYTNIIEVWNDFKKYYSTVSSIENKQSQITVNTLTSWIDDINRSSNTGYFSNKEGDFNKYLKIIIEKSYTTSRLKDDIKSGQKYITFLKENKIIEEQKQNFTTLTDSGNTIMQYIFNLRNSYFVSPVNPRTPTATRPVFFAESVFYSLFKRTEGMETPTQIKPSDTDILARFNVTDFNAQLNTVKIELKKYNLSQIDTNNTEWNNMINVIDRLTKLKITITDFDNFIQLMKEFGANTIKEWYDVLDKLTKIKIQSYSNIKIFIELLTGFGVLYNTNFVAFITIITEFNADLSKSLDPVTGFVDDMKAIGYKYNTNQKEVDSIVRYFAKCNYTLNTYKRDKSSETGFDCNNLSETVDNSIIGLPSLIVRSLHSYKSPNSINNNLYDIQFPGLIEKNVTYCDVIEVLHQAYILAKNLTSYNKENAIISTNLSIIVSFFYAEELQNIVKSLKSYAPTDKRNLLMRGVSDGMINYSKIFKNDPQRQSEYKMYTSIANFIRIFPALSFQYLSSEIISKCGTDPNCQYYTVNVNPEYSNSKASTTDSTINKRPNGPVL